MYSVDGVLRTAIAEDLVPGTVLRGTNRDGTSPDWSDCTIVKVYVPEGIGRNTKPYKNVELVRPYMCLSKHGTASVAMETFKVPDYRLLEADCHLKVVLMSTGKPATTLR